MLISNSVKIEIAASSFILDTLCFQLNHSYSLVSAELVILNH